MNKSSAGEQDTIHAKIYGATGKLSAVADLIRSANELPDDALPSVAEILQGLADEMNGLGGQIELLESGTSTSQPDGRSRESLARESAATLDELGVITEQVQTQLWTMVQLMDGGKSRHLRPLAVIALDRAEDAARIIQDGTRD
ncbi:hypothetical protein [Ectothiorhodospira variabilis]|uniref:hypothetical protein n=1 Tax=Ectothiorhodospira variabilis TaxID=505694 RepID=UPI001EFB98F9|nr:hypothetical protein [Ectothiorhodospira variabilis]MCG5494417.1 hypothetical protein [Ectothiorhodospira variabilis]MCG5503212.1 hypothetical protein [Ectothiorhodospira variabilis]MCG5506029.1 hypothetical protein [Ectothiorhodospira variabilis]